VLEEILVAHSVPRELLNRTVGQATEALQLLELVGVEIDLRSRQRLLLDPGQNTECLQLA
jgi:hypothetical protein